MNSALEGISTDHDAQLIKLQSYVITVDLLAVRGRASMHRLTFLLNVSIVRIIERIIAMIQFSPIP